MPATEYNLKPVSKLTTGAIGPPGNRVFYLQARDAIQLVTLIVEKQQVQLLAAKVEEFLAELDERLPDLPKVSLEFNEEDMAIEQPIDPAFRIGFLGLGYDDEDDLLVLVAREVEASDDDDQIASVARFWCTRSQLLTMCHLGVEVASRGRPICGNCGEPIDPESHFCPKSNGHKK
jgi:uncharacterized repeat protein (TIGR03847 family)